MFTEDVVFILLDAQAEMTARVAYIIRMTQITLKFIYNALLAYKLELCFLSFQIFRDFPTCENWLYYTIDFLSLFKFFLFLCLFPSSFILMNFLSHCFLYNVQ